MHFKQQKHIYDNNSCSYGQFIQKLMHLIAKKNSHQCRFTLAAKCGKYITLLDFNNQNMQQFTNLR